jgi:hypothetical protein
MSALRLPPRDAEEKDDVLEGDEEDGDATGAATRFDSCLNMNPMRMALSAAGDAPASNWIARTRLLSC